MFRGKLAALVAARSYRELQTEVQSGHPKYGKRQHEFKEHAAHFKRLHRALAPLEYGLHLIHDKDEADKKTPDLPPELHAMAVEFRDVQEEWDGMQEKKELIAVLTSQQRAAQDIDEVYGFGLGSVDIAFGMAQRDKRGVPSSRGLLMQLAQLITIAEHINTLHETLRNAGRISKVFHHHRTVRMYAQDPEATAADIAFYAYFYADLTNAPDKYLRKEGDEYTTSVKGNAFFYAPHLHGLVPTEGIFNPENNPSPPPIVLESFASFTDDWHRAHGSPTQADLDAFQTLRRDPLQKNYTPMHMKTWEKQAWDKRLQRQTMREYAFQDMCFWILNEKYTVPTGEEARVLGYGEVAEKGRAAEQSGKAGGPQGAAVGAESPGAEAAETGEVAGSSKGNKKKNKKKGKGKR